MQHTTMTNGSSSPPPAVAMNGQSPGTSAATAFTPERVQELVAALEDPFDPSEIKWRVTNTCKVGGPKGPRDRGQMLAYADPRAYTDRLNDLFTPLGWTRDYNVQTVQNFERKERGATERSITAKIVVTCKVTIHGFGAHTGLGEEWADNENAGTSAEAQAFKRACSCFRLGRYLYDLDGNWVDLDERKQPLSRPRLPDWALPKRQPGDTTCRNGNGHTGTNGHAQQKSVAPVDVAALKARVQSLCEQVGRGLARSVMKSIATTEDLEHILDPAVLSALSAKLEDTLRGVERLRRSTGVVGQASFSRFCKQMNLAGDCLDEIPDHGALRQLIEALERAADATPRHQNGGGQTTPAADNRR